MNRLDPLHLPVFGNSFLMGISFALLLSFNPCTVPFLARECSRACCVVPAQCRLICSDHFAAHVGRVAVLALFRARYCRAAQQPPVSLSVRAHNDALP